MNSFLNFADVKVRIGEHGFGRCHVCCGKGLNAYEDPVLGRLRIDHPEWFKTPEERTARDTGHWARHHFRDEFQAEANRRYIEITVLESTKEVVVLVVDEKAVHICADCLEKLYRDMVPTQNVSCAVHVSEDETSTWDKSETVSEVEGMSVKTVAYKKNKGGRPKKKA